MGCTTVRNIYGPRGPGTGLPEAVKERRKEVQPPVFITIEQMAVNPWKTAIPKVQTDNG